MSVDSICMPTRHSSGGSSFWFIVEQPASAASRASVPTTRNSAFRIDSIFGSPPGKVMCYRLQAPRAAARSIDAVTSVTPFSLT